MARLFTSGFEWGHAAAENSGSGGFLATAGAARSGSYGLRNALVIYSNTGVLDRIYYLRFYLRRNGAPGTDSTTVIVRASGAVALFSWRAKTDGSFEVLNGGTSGSVLYNTGILTDSEWYRIEFGWKISSGSGDDYAELQVNGSSIGSSTTLTVGTAAHADFAAPSLGGTFDNDIDDMALNDDQGSNQNSWPGEGKIVLCVPISDSQDGSWRGGAGGTGIDLSTAVNNIPPVGVVSGSATNTSQIESVDSSGDNATDEYRANMTTYTNAGITASDTITVVHPMVSAGEDIATNSKAVSVGCQSNPAGSMSAVTIDAGAINTWPTNWRGHLGPPVYNPSVTLGNSPVVALRKTDTGTRVLGVAALGLNVEYQPASIVLPPPPRVYEAATRRSYSY